MKVTDSKNVTEWLDQRISFNKLMKVLMTEYWIPKNINWLWAMGVILITMFLVLFITGLFLVMYYKPDAMLAYDSVNNTIMREVGYGWLWRHMHAVAASLIFLVIYIHMFVGIYYGSYKRGREIIWLTGMVLFMLFSGEGFSGYMLPWGQMSYWAAAVITNLPSAIPGVGADVVTWIRGNFVVSDATLTRFFMLHVCLMPIAVVAVTAIHMLSLRTPHVNNEDSEEIDFEKEAEKFMAGNTKESKVIPFWPGFLSKDIFIVCLFMAFYMWLVCFHYEFAMDPINFEKADGLKTPTHIYPEWYFLWSYEVLRGFFFNGNLGLVAFAIANGIFLALPFLDADPTIKPAHKRPRFNVWFWVLLVDMMVLTLYGKLPPTGVNAYIGLVSSLIFLGCFAVLPIITKADYKEAK